MKSKSVFILFVFSILNMLVLTVVFAQETKVYKENEISDSVVKEELSFKKNNECVRNHENGECIKTRQFRPMLNDQSDSKLETEAKPVASLAVMITFETNSAELTYTAKQALNIIGRNMSEITDSDFVVEGHADSRGSDELNQRLSEARALSVVSFLVREYGLDKNRFQAIGKSYTAMLNPKNPADPVNRRAIFIREGK